MGAAAGDLAYPAKQLRLAIDRKRSNQADSRELLEAFPPWYPRLLAWFRIGLIGRDPALVPFPTPLLDLGIVAAQVVSTLVGDFQSSNIVRRCKTSPLESGNHCRRSDAAIGIASAQPFKLHDRKLDLF
jgi:hypothetical protein